MRRYEYRVVDPNKHADTMPIDCRTAPHMLNDLGDDGWLLVQVIRERTPHEEWVMAREKSDGD